MKKKSGKVYLVGAGPGSADLMTLRAVACLAEADVVLYDRLVPVGVLKKYAPRARLVDVGKKASYHAIAQEKIERILVDEARKGRIVVRLKGGDPYIFGRGGEEAESLADAGVDFEVVPGVSSAFAAPLFAGIPLTHRKFAPGIAIVTGHGKSAKPWPALSKMGTIVFLMGMGNLQANMRNLAKAGLDGTTPAAVVQWGGTGEQKSVTATVATLADQVREAGLKAPAVIVVGEVVRLAKKLNWFEKSRFYGKTFLVTRAPEDNAALREILERDGARVIEWPSYEYVPAKSGAQKIMDKISSFDWIVFTSARAVRFFGGIYFKKHGDTRALAKVKIAAVGPATAAALKKMGFWIDLIPKKKSSAGLAAEKRFSRTSGLKIFLPQAADARRDFEEALKSRHKIVHAVFYRKKNIRHSSDECRELLRQKIDWILFFSPSAADAFVKGLGREANLQIFASCGLAAIGKTTAQRLPRRADVVSNRGTFEDLLKRIEKFQGSIM